jgi:phosphoribosyl 1,2-cyclic phosphodiesterase
MRVVFWGVRGSIATPDADFSRYGGNTPCVELVLDANRSLVFDAGLGLRWQASAMLDRQNVGNRLEILLSHCHWDHIQGIPFTGLMYLPHNEVVLHGAGYPQRALLDNLSEQLRPEFCPVPNFLTTEVGAHVMVQQLSHQQWFDCAGARVRWGFLPRGNNPSHVVGYRVESAHRSVAYLTDVEYPQGAQSCAEARELAKDVDLLIHDAQFLPAEKAATLNRGHSTYEDALALARVCGAKRLVCTHHDPSRTDQELDEIAAWLRQIQDVQACVAYEGLDIDLAAARKSSKRPRAPRAVKA